MSLTAKQRSSLSAQAHSLKPTIQIGKEGVTQAQIDTINRHLDHHELIKVRFNEHKDRKIELSALITEKTSSQQVSLLGHTLTLYRASSDPNKGKIAI
jgi:RNA-binding protein